MGLHVVRSAVLGPFQIEVFRLQQFRRVESNADLATCHLATFFECTDDLGLHRQQ